MADPTDPLPSTKGTSTKSASTASVFEPNRAVLVRQRRFSRIREVIKPPDGPPPIWGGWQRVALPPRNLQLNSPFSESLADGFITVTLAIDVTCQPSFDYAKRALEGDPSLTDVHGDVQKSFAPIVDGLVRSMVKSLSPADVAGEQDRRADEIRKAVVDTFLNNDVTCAATCTLAVRIDWPKEGAEPQAIPDYELFKRIWTQYHTYFKKKRDLEQTFAVEKHMQEMAKKETEIQQAKVKAEKDKLLREIDDAARRDVLEADSQLKLFGITITNKEEGELLGLEVNARERRMKTFDGERKFLQAETEVLELDATRALADERAKAAGRLAAGEIERGEIELLKLRQLATHVTQLVQQEKVLQVLPELAKAVGGQSPAIQHLSVMQTSDGNGAGAVPGSAAANVAQTLAIIREAVTFLEGGRA